MKNWRQLFTLFAIIFLVQFVFSCRVSKLEKGSSALEKPSSTYIPSKEYIKSIEIQRDTFSVLYSDLEKKSSAKEVQLGATYESYLSDSQNKEIQIREQIKQLSQQSRTSGAKRDTVVKESEKFVYPETNQKSIAFFCPDKMKEGIPSDVYAMLGYIFTTNEEIKTELLSVINEIQKEKNEPFLSLNDIVTKGVNLGEYIKIELKDPAKAFDIEFISNTSNEPIKIFDNSTKEYSTQTFQWHWSVTPKPDTKGDGANLIFVVTPYDKDFKPLKETKRSFTIQIDFKDDFLTSLLNFAHRDIKFTVGAIITPILSFFAGIFIKRRKDDNENISNA